jgi:hypothetical protein
MPKADKPQRLTINVKHTVTTIEIHKLEGFCPQCGTQIETDNAAAITRYEEGVDTETAHTCGALLCIRGRAQKPRILTPENAGEISIPGRANNNKVPLK